ncbi:MAG: FIST signal transduction protein [Elusimicrobiota bacterium]
MKIEQRRWETESGWILEGDPLTKKAQLVFVFGATNTIKDLKRLKEIKDFYPQSEIIGCSTAGEICGTRVYDDSLVVTAAHFEKSTIQVEKEKISEPSQSTTVGEKLAQKLEKKGLVHVFVLSDGLKVNGSDLVKGLTKNLPSNVQVTGGLSGDGARFTETIVLSHGSAESGTICVIGFYGDKLKIGFGSLGGWDTFGPKRKITKSKGNVLFELDGKSALDLYKSYLGEHASGLPATGLLFPLCLMTENNEKGVVRTILSVNESEKSMTFAGDIPEGEFAFLMRANFDRLIDGAQGAAKICQQAINQPAELAILISCVGRKLILKQRTEEEVEAVREIQGESTILTGFYSYGEIAPFIANFKCELHNQTMTITTFSEEK